MGGEVDGGGNLLAFVPVASPLGEPQEDLLDLATAPGYQLYLSCFFGEVRLRLGGVDLSPGGAVATLGFALALAGAVRDAAAGAASMHFLEDDRQLHLTRTDGQVHLTASYTPAGARLSYQELRRTVRDGVRDLLDDLHTRHPRLRANPELARQLALLPDDLR